MDRLFLDANILFSAAYRLDGGRRRLWDLAGAELITCVYAATEAQRNLAPAHQAELKKLLEDVAVIRTHHRRLARRPPPSGDASRDVISMQYSGGRSKPASTGRNM